MTRLLLSLLAAASLLRADFDPKHWQWRKPIRVKPDSPVSAAPVDAGVFRGSLTRLDDIRIVRNGAEVPYALAILSRRREQQESEPSISDKAAVSGEGVQATLDLGAHSRHNQLRIETARVNFKQKVRIETSDDRKHWAKARDDGFIFDFSQGDRHVSVLTVDYPLSTRRYVRLTISGWTNPEDLRAAWLTYLSETSGVRDALAKVTPQVSEDAKEQTTTWTADLGTAGLPYDQLDAEAGPGMFYRTVDIETSTDAKSWLYAGGGAISRTADSERLTLTFPEQWERYLRLRVHNGDNAPLTIRRMTFSANRRVLKFPSSATGEYWVYYGNPDSKQPSYDFAQVTPAEAAVADAALGAEERNPAYQPPVPPEKPWSDRHPQVLFAVLALAVIGMGVVAVRLLLKLRANGGTGV